MSYGIMDQPNHMDKNKNMLLYKEDLISDVKKLVLQPADRQ